MIDMMNRRPHLISDDSSSNGTSNDELNRSDNKLKTSESQHLVMIKEESENGLQPLTIPQETYGDEPDATTPTQYVPATPTLLVPSLRGRLFIEGTAHICRGQWAMSDDAHGLPGQTSDFEFRLVKPGEGSQDVAFPKNGKYQGWFILKQAPPLKPTVKIDDREMTMTFIKDEQSHGYNVEGDGYNKFGSFTLRGKLSSDGSIQMYRVYSTKPVKKRTVSPTNEKSKKRPSFSNGTTTTATTPAINTTTITTTIPAPLSARESSGRIRTKKSYDYDTTTTSTSYPTATTSATPKTPKGHHTAASVSQIVPSDITPSVVESKHILPPSSSQSTATVNTPIVRTESGRSQRIPLPLQKCADLLKELSKQPHAFWFLEPVDYIKLNILDYPIIIAEPMDFKTIRTNIEANYYPTPEAFAEHMRLVFRNAITYNVARDHLVNIAAREMSSRFEEKFRILLTQLSQNTQILNANAALSLAIDDSITTSSSSSSSKRSGSKTPNTGRLSNVGLQRSVSVGSFSGGSKKTVPPGGGPRVADIVLPPPLDPSAHYLADMQKRMEEMQNEIMKLRTAVRQNEVQQHIYVQRDAAHNPLTFEEKKSLIAEINRLPEYKQIQVFEIIRASNTLPQDVDEDVEVPLDELDTLTLRKLQKFVDECYGEKRRRESINSISSLSPAKKIKKPNPMTSTTTTTSRTTTINNAGNSSSSSSITNRNSSQFNSTLSSQLESSSYESSHNSSSYSPDTSDLLFPSHHLEEEEEEEIATATAVSSSSSTGVNTGGVGLGGPHDLIHDDEEDEELPETGDLLFGSEHFEVLRSHSYEYGSDNESVKGEQEEDEDNIKSGQEHENTQKSGVNINMNAWLLPSSSTAMTTNKPTSTVSFSNMSHIDDKTVSSAMSETWKQAVHEMKEQEIRQIKIKQEEEKLALLREERRKAALNMHEYNSGQSSVTSAHYNTTHISTTTTTSSSTEEQRDEERKKLSNLAQTVHLSSTLEDDDLRMFMEEGN